MAAGSDLTEHLRRFPLRYRECFGAEDLAAHAAAAAFLSPDRPVQVSTRELTGGARECTVVSHDHPALFSLIAGVLSSSGMDIASGDAFTSSEAPRREARGRRMPPGRRLQRPAASGAPASRRVIVDRFAGEVRGPLDPERWREQVLEALEEVLRMLEDGRAESNRRARALVNDMVAATLSALAFDATRGLLPVSIDVDPSTEGITMLRVVSEDTPFFLYAFSSALALRGLAIEQVRIRTEGRSIRDEFGIVDGSGRPVVDADTLDGLRLSALLTKQFSYFLASAPDPTAALARFEALVEGLFSSAERERWVRSLSDPRSLEDLARLLGASDYLWEDFIRGQYETLLPILLRPERGVAPPPDPESLARRLQASLDREEGYEAKVEALNRLKDAEVFACDLAHILDPTAGHAELARRLTRLAECVIEAATRIVRERLGGRHGVPRTVAGLAVPFVVAGLGKLGGEALGYASDIELLVLYRDAGSTDGVEPLDNGEYFGRLARELAAVIRAKREGIFSVDLRLRPYGSAGQAAASLESFCRYYGRGGDAHAYERLALVSLRSVAGDFDFGSLVERVRDEMLYASGSIDLESLRELRARQVREKDALRRANAKFSPGALVDLEYTVQILQVMHGRGHAALRTPRVREALAALAGAGVLAPNEAERLSEAYGFLRGLINALRMLRGSALDLYLPPPASEEYVHLARRMNYPAGDDPARRLHVDFEARTAEVRSFMQRHFGSQALLSGEAGSLADLVLSEEVPGPQRERLLRAAGFREISRAERNLLSLAGEGTRELFARVAVLAADMLPRKPDADMALNNWERFARGIGDREAEYARMLRQPTRLDILLSVFASSQYLSDTLCADPAVFDALVEPLARGSVLTREGLERSLGTAPEGDPEERRETLRLVKRRELARIGIRDICLGAPLPEVCAELSELADALISRALRGVSGGDGLVVLAYGKLGGRELNYSSDVDLVGVRVGGGSEGSRALEDLRAELGAHGVSGWVYRVDYRLRPWGSSGELESSRAALLRYYAESASPWELQAALKARAVAGPREEGNALVGAIRHVLVERVARILRLPDGRQRLLAGIRHRRGAVARPGGRLARPDADVKSGPGGIRDVEFAVQAVQLLGCTRRPELVEGNTLKAIDSAASTGELDPPAAALLGESYVFLRKVEHYLQVYDNRQTHAIPSEPGRVEHLARCILGHLATAGELRERLEHTRALVAAEASRILGG